MNFAVGDGKEKRSKWGALATEHRRGSAVQLMERDLQASWFRYDGDEPRDALRAGEGAA